MCSSLLLSSPLVSRAPGECLCFVLLSNIHRHFPDCRRFSDNCASYIILTLFSSLYCFYICRRSTRHFFPSYCPPYYPTGKETVAARIGYTWSVPKEHSGSCYLETPKRVVPLASLVCSLAIKTLGKTGCSSLTHYHTLAEQNKKKEYNNIFLVAARDSPALPSEKNFPIHFFRPCDFLHSPAFYSTEDIHGVRHGHV